MCPLGRTGEIRRMADPTRCPDCGATLAGMYCPSCGLALRGPLAIELWQVITSQEALERRRADLIRRLRTASAAPAAASAAEPAAQPAAAASGAAAPRPAPAGAWAPAQRTTWTPVQLPAPRPRKE